jgi:hypothetical protein
MIEIHKWCEQAFGKIDYFTTWDVDFARGTEDYVEFKFYKEEMASAFVLQWTDYCIDHEVQFALGMLSWDEL